MIGSWYHTKRRGAVMMFIWNYIRITLYPVAPILICGLSVWVCRRIFVKLLGRDSYHILMAASVIGTPVHELGHAMMCPLFGHKIVEMVLWQYGSDDGYLGYVRHSRDTDNPYQWLGDLFVSTGPIFSGMAVLSLLLMIFFPNTWSAHISSVVSLVEEDASVLAGIFSGLRMIPDLLAELTCSPAALGRIVVILVMLSVSLRINLSPQDIEGAVYGLPPYLMVTLAVTLIVTLLGRTVSAAVVGALETFSVFLTAMFSLVLVFSAAQILLALLIRWVQALLRG